MVQEAAARRKQHRQYDEERCQGHASREKQEEIDKPHRKEDGCEETPGSKRRGAVDNPGKNLLTTTMKAARKNSNISQILSVCLHSQQLPAVFLVYQQCGLSLQRPQHVNS